MTMPLSPTTSAPVRRAFPALFAGVIMNMVFGSLYAWSVFISGLEHDLAIQRTDVSIVFSLAVVSFTVGNFTAPFAFGRIPTALLPLIALVAGAGGLALAALGDGYQAVITGYGILFGFGCGFAYNTALQAAQVAMPDRPGLANGIIISAFALGSIIAAYLLTQSITSQGVRATFWLQAIAVAGVTLAAAISLGYSRVQLTQPGPIRDTTTNTHILHISWLGFFLGALAGVLSIGHASPIIAHFGGTAAACVLGVTLLGIGNATGRLAAGWLSDRISVRSVAGIAHLCGAIGFVVVLGNPSGEGAVITMAMAGIAYGMTASVYPSAVAIFMGRAAYGRNFAILLTAWGAAGLLGPMLGGYFFDISGDYRISLEFACVASMFAVINAMRLPRTRLTDA